MAIWTSEIKEIEKLYESLKGQLPDLEKELERLIKADDENMILLYSRRCLEVIITDLCECELKRPRKTEPLHGIIDKLHKEEKVPSHIIASMHGLNEISTYGAHPKDFDPKQVRTTLINLDTIIEWFLKHKKGGAKIVARSAEEIRQEVKSTEEIKKRIQIPRKRLISFITGSILLIVIVVAVLFFTNTIGGGKKVKEPEKSIAVLPFESIGSDEDKIWFNDGITDIIINQLTKIDNLRVLGRTSTLQYKETRKPISEIGKELQVNYIIEGTVQRQENKIRISVQLIRVHNEDHLWSEIYDKYWEEIFEVQSDIAEKVAQELKTILTPEEVEKIKEKGTDSNEAYDLYLKGRYFLNRRTKDDLIRSVEYLGQSIEIDHDYGLVYAGLAEAYYIMTYYNWIDQKEGWVKSKEFTLKALEIDKNLSEAHITRGAIALWNEWDWKVAGDEFKLAIDLNPNLPTAHQYFAEYLNIIGRNDDAFDQIDLALRLDPLSLVINHVKSWIYFSTQNYSSALRQIQKVHEIDKNFTTAYMYAFYSYMRQKMYPEAANELKKSLSVRVSNLKYAQSIDSIYQDSGIEGVLKLLIHIYSSASFPNNYNLAKVYSEIGDKEMAIKYLEEAFIMHDPSVIHILNNPSFIDLYSEPGFKAIVKKMGLSAYQKVK